MSTVLVAAIVVVLTAAAVVSWILDIGNDADRRMLAEHSDD